MRFRTAQGSVSHEEREAVDVLQGDGSAFGHSVQWVIRHVHGKLGFQRKTLVESSQLCAPPAR